MAKKRYRPLDDFNQSLEDQELEQLEGFEFGRDPKKTKARSSSYSNPYSSPVDFETPEEQETYQRISKGMAENAYADYVASDPYNPQISDKHFTAGGLTYDPLKEPGDFENFWNLTFGTANEIHADALRGHQLRNRQEILKLDKEKSQYEPDTKEYKDLEKKILDIEEDSADLEADIEEIELSLSEEENQVSPLYRAKAFAGQQEESSVKNYFGSAEFAEDLGGGLSDAFWLGTSIALGAGAAMVPTMASAASLNPYVVAGTGLALGGGSAVAAYKMRSNESAAEMFSSYQERYANLVDNFRAENNGENPTKEQDAALDAEALIGAEQMYQRNMALTAVDVAQIAIGVTPYGRIMKGLGGPMMASKFARRVKSAGKFGAILGAEATLEGFEEAYQYLTKEQYKLGMYDQYDKSELPFLTALANAPYVGDRAVEGMVDMYAHRSGNGLTNTKEFRNSTRAGMVLGMFMGGVMGGVVNPITSGVGEISERKVLSPELEELSSSLSDGPWETMVNVDQVSKKVDYIAESLKRNGGKNVMRAFSIFKEQQEEAGNPNKIEFDKVEKSLKTTIGLYNMHKNNNPKLAEDILIAAVKGHEYLNYYIGRTEEDIEKSSNQVQELLNATKEFQEAFTEKTKGYKSAHNLALEIKAIEKLLNNTKEVEAEAKKFKKYSNDELVNDMINFNKKERTEELSRKKDILEAELERLSKEENSLTTEEFENLGTLNDEKLIEAHASKIGNEINKNFLANLNAGLVNPKQSFNLINHPFVKDVAAAERRAEEARKKGEEDKKKYEEGTKESSEEPIEEGDEVNYLDRFFKYMGKVGDKFRLKPLSKTGEEEILVGSGVFKALRKFVSVSNLKSKIKEVVNKQKNNSKDTEDSNKGKQSAEDLEKRKKDNEDAVAGKDDGIESVEGTEPKVNTDITAYITEELQKLYRDYINIGVDNDNFVSKIYKFFHSRSKKELEDLDVILKVERNSIPEEVAKVWRRGDNLMDYLVNNPEQAKLLLKNLRVKVTLKDDKFKEKSKNNTSTYLMNANKQTFEQEGLKEYNNYLETFVNILNLTPFRSKDETPIKARIAHANYGKFNNLKDEKGKQLKNRIDEEFRDEIANKELVFAWQDNNEQIILNGTSIGAPVERGGVAGAIYLLYKHIMEGDVYGGTVVGTPTKLNRRRINTKESSVLFDIYKKLTLSNVGEKDSFVFSDIYEEKGFRNLSAKQIINFLLPRTLGVNMDSVIDAVENRDVIWGKLTDAAFEQLKGIRFIPKGTATRLLFGANSISRQGKVLRAQLYNHDLRKGISIFQQEGKYVKQVYNVVGKKETETFNISEEEAYAEMEKYFNEFVTSNITHQAKGPELNNSIFSFKGLQVLKEIEYFGVVRKKGEDSELYSNMLIEGEDPVLTSDVKKVGPKGNQRVQINRQVVISPTDITTERENVIVTPEPKAELKKLYQGYNTFQNRVFNYFTFNKEEAKEYGKNVRSIVLDLKDFLKANSEEYLNLKKEDYRITGKIFDILDNSKEGLEKQEQFFEYLKSKGYKGLDYSMFEDSQYVVTFEETVADTLESKAEPTTTTQQTSDTTAAQTSLFEEEEVDETLEKVDDDPLDEESNLGFGDDEGDEGGPTPQAMTATKELDESLPLIDIKEAREYLRRVLGTKVPVYVEEGILRVGKKGAKAYAYFVDGAITLSTLGRKSSEYHEALHAVEDIYLTEKQIENLNKETVKTYGEPSQENITEVMKDRGMSSEKARNYLLAEYRAEEYRAYELKRVDMSTLSDTLKFWYNTLKNYITTIFKGLHSKRLYYKISQGQYANQSTDVTAYRVENKSKESTQEQNLRDLLGSEVEIFEAAKSMLFEYLKLSITNINKREKTNIVTFRNLKDLNKFLSVRSFQYILNAAIKETKDENQVKVLTGIKENLSFFISSPPEGSKKFGGLIPEMINTLGIRSNTEEKDKDLKDSNPDLAAIKAPFEFSALDSATIGTKLLFEFFPQRDREGSILLNPKTGLTSIARGIDVFNKMQKILTNTPQGYNNEGVFIGGFEAMQLKLQEIAPRIPLFKGFVEDVLSQLTEEQQNQFFRVMNMKEYAFTAITERGNSYIDNRTGEPVNKKDVRVFDAAVEGLVWSIRTAWKEKYKRKFFTFEEIIPDEEEGVNSEVVIKVKDISEIISIMKDHYRKNFYALKKEGGVVIGETPLFRKKSIEEFSKNLVDLLSAIGIEIPQYTIIDYIKTNSLANNYASGYDKLMKGLGKGRGIRDLFAIEVPYSIGQMYMEANKNDGVVSGEFNLDSKNTFDDNTSVLKALAEIASLAEENVPQSTVKGADGKTFWTNSLPNFIFNVTDRINSSKVELNNIMQDRWTKGSIYIMKKKEETELKINTFLTSRNLDSNKGGKDYKSLADREYLANTINKMFTGKDENRIVNFPTFADKSVWYMLRGASIEELYSEFVYFDTETKSIRIRETSKHTNDVLTIFSNYIIEEAERIQQIEEDLKTLEDNQLTATIHYTKLKEDDTADRTTANGIKMLIFPSLNDESILKQIGLKKEDGNWFENKDIGEIKENLKPFIIKSLEERIHRDLETILKNNFIAKIEDKGNLQGYRFINDATNPISTEIRKKFKLKPQNLIASLSINTMIANVEVTKIFSGDIAYYKNYEDLTKRIVAIIAPGSPRRLTSDSSYTAAVVKDYILNSSKLIQNYVSYLQDKKGYTKKQAEKIVEGYADTNVTDGQAFITLERWRDIMIDLGDIDRAAIEGAYERLNDPKGEPTEQDVMLVMAQPLKGMVFTRRDSEVHGKSEQIPTYMKYSQAVLIPAFVENKADLGELLKAMNRDKVDEVVFESGIKEGALFPTRIADKQGNLLAAENITFNKMYIKNRDWKLQQPLTPHETLEQLEGSQVKKNILSDIKLLADYIVPYSYKEGKKWKTKDRVIKGYELVEEFHGVDSALSDIEFQKLSEEWGIVNQEDGYAIKNVEALRDSLVKDFAKDDAVAQKIVDLLDLQESRGVKEFVIPFDNNPFDDVIERKIASIITKRLVKLKMPGGSYIQTSGLGMTKAKRFTNLTEAEQRELKSQMIFEDENSRLDAAMWDQETGKAKGAQVFLPNYMRKLIPNNKFQNKEELKKYIKDKRLLEVIGYRIPNQGFSSIDALEVVGFLPQAYGDTIIAYDEITTKTGSDFDIDKMYVMLPSFEYIYELGKDGKKTKTVKGIKYVNFDASKTSFQENLASNLNKGKLAAKALKNRKLELYRAILQSEHTFADVINPLDSVDTKNNSMFVRYLEAKSSLSEKEIETIEKYISTNKEGNYVFSDNFYSEANKLITLKEQEDLEWFSLTKQLKIREIYLGGQFGVGQLARHKVDQAISQYSPGWKEQGLESPYYFAGEDFGIGNVTPEGSSDLSQSTILNSDKTIATILSARLDAYVDIAKDPYIFYINNNALTANTVALMDRLGTDPQWTDMFTSLPAMKTFVNITKSINSGNIPSLKITEEGKTITKTFSNAENYVTARFQQAINDKLEKEKKKENTSDVRTFNLMSKKGRQSRYNVLNNLPKETEIEERILVEDLYTVQALSKLIDSSLETTSLNNLYSQLALFKYFIELKTKATVLNKGVTASKYDTQGARGGFAQGIIFDELFAEILETNLAGFANRFNATMAGKYKEHGPELLKKLFGDRFLLGNDNYRGILKRIALNTRHLKDFKENEEYIRNLHRNFRSFIYTETEYFKSIDIKDLLYSSNNIEVRLSQAQVTPELENNLLLKYLQPIGKSLANGSAFISAPSRLAKSGKQKNDLTSAWRDLLYSEDAKTRKLGEDLYKASLLFSGYRNGSFTFQELAPLEFEVETGIYDQFGEIATILKAEGDPNNDYIGRFLMTQMSNPEIVPEADYDTLSLKKNKLSKHEFLLAVKEERVYKYLVSAMIKEKGEIKAYPEFVPFISSLEGNTRRLYKFEGLKNKGTLEKPNFVPLYSMVEAFNYSEKGQQIYESADIRKGTAIRKNIKVLKVDGKILQIFRGKDSESIKFRETLENFLEETRDVSSQDMFYKNENYNSIAPWTNVYTEQPVLNDTQETPTIYEGSGLNPKRTLDNAFTGYIDSSLKTFSSIEDAVNKGMSVENATQLAAKYNLDLQTEIESLPESLDFENSFSVNYDLAGYGLAIQRAKMLLKSGVIGYQEIKSGSDTFYLNSKPIEVLLEEVKSAVDSKPYLKAIRDLVGPKVDQSNMEVVTVVLEDNVVKRDALLGLYATETDAVSPGVIIMKETGDKFKDAITLLHEILHVFTIKEVLSDPVLRKKTTALLNLYISRGLKTAPAGLRKVIEAYQADTKNEELERLALAEFITYGLTDLGVISKLKQLKIKREGGVQTSLFEKFESAFDSLVQIVLDTFGYTEKNLDASAYDLLLTMVGEVITQASSLQANKKYAEQRIINKFKEESELSKLLNSHSTALKNINTEFTKKC